MAEDNTDHHPSLATSTIDITVQGLKRQANQEPGRSWWREKGKSPEACQEVMAVSEDAPLNVILDKLEELGYERPDSLSRNDVPWDQWTTKVKFHPFEEVQVVQDQPSEPGKSIDIDSTLIAYTNRVFGKQIEFNLSNNEYNRHGLPGDNLTDSLGLHVAFHRTVRMPDDDKLHQLPASLGTFPLYSVAAHSERLPDKMAEEGGVFLPMWQREALWISFKTTSSSPYALRIYVGHINAVSGLEMKDASVTSETTESNQDYLVVPGQQWLDGICVAPGLVRQFVAMPLGSGYTVEGQKTGKETHGGLQIEVIPSFEKNLRTWIKSPDSSLSSTELQDQLLYHRLYEYKTPRELGLVVGDKMRLYPKKAFDVVPCILSDVIKEKEQNQTIIFKSAQARAVSGYLRRGGGYSQATVWPSRPNKRAKKMAKSLSSTSTFDISDDWSHSVDIFPADSASQIGSASPSWLSARIECNLGEEAGIVLRKETGSDLGEEGAHELAEDNEVCSAPEIVTKDLKAMGLAAGGKLVQDIYRDSHPARIWNVEAAKIVHVHILDPASCEAVTHIVPPPPPVDTKRYLADGGAFFAVEEQPENRVEGGDFDAVKSVSAMDRDVGVAEQNSLDPSKPTQCTCGVRLCDCVVRPCGHQFCNVCVRAIDPTSPSLSAAITSAEPDSQRPWACPTCKARVSYVAGFSAPMNLPGEEAVKVRVPVHVLEVRDGRVAFRSIQNSRL